MDLWRHRHAVHYQSAVAAAPRASEVVRAVALSPNGSGLAAGSEGLVFRIEGAKLQRLDERPKTGTTTEAKS